MSSPFDISPILIVFACFLTEKHKRTEAGVTRLKRKFNPREINYLVQFEGGVLARPAPVVNEWFLRRITSVALPFARWSGQRVWDVANRSSLFFLLFAPAAEFSD